jgi:hypothetical protein
VPKQCRLANVETDESFGFLIDNFDTLDLGSARSFVHVLDEAFHGVRLPLEDRFNGAVPTICNPTRHRALPRHPAHRVPKEHSLHAASDDDMTPNHRHILPAWSSAKS